MMIYILMKEHQFCVVDDSVFVYCRLMNAVLRKFHSVE